MPFDYYNRLGRKQQTIYRQSDRLIEVPLPDPMVLATVLPELEESLAEGSRMGVQRGSTYLVDGINDQLRIAPAAVRVLAARPSRDWGELHGLYELAEDGEPARITVWMRTAQRRQVVAFKTFLRTLLHELCHHLDYEHFELADSFHTEGFFKRESNLFRQLDGARR